MPHPCAADKLKQGMPHSGAADKLKPETPSPPVRRISSSWRLSGFFAEHVRGFM